MSKLNTERRKELPDDEFAGPGRSYPIPDISHGRAALSMLHNAPPAEQARIKAKVHRKFPGIGHGK